MLRTVQSLYLDKSIKDIIDLKDFKHWCKYSDVSQFENIEEVHNINMPELSKLLGRWQVNVRLPYEVAEFINEKFQRCKTTVILMAYIRSESN